MKTVTFKKGQTYHLDVVYPYYGLFNSNVCYNVDEDGDADDGGEHVFFTLNVQLEYKVTITN